METYIKNKTELDELTRQRYMYAPVVTPGDTPIYVNVTKIGALALWDSVKASGYAMRLTEVTERSVSLNVERKDWEE